MSGDPRQVMSVWRVGEAERLVLDGTAKERQVPCRRCKTAKVTMPPIRVAEAMLLQRECQRRGWKPLMPDELAACDACIPLERQEVTAAADPEPSRPRKPGPRPRVPGLPEVD